MSMIVGVDACRNRSGGARAHLIGILASGDPARHGIREVHVWTHQSLMGSIPDRPWLTRHGPPDLERSLARQLWWQATRLPSEARDAGCDVLFTTDASTLCLFRPMVVLNQDLLAYEPGVMRGNPLSTQRLRVHAIRAVQNWAMRRADGVIFLTEYAARVVQECCGALGVTCQIPHGIGDDFKQTEVTERWPAPGERAIRCVYVSNTALYKHQDSVVAAVAELRRRGHDIRLTLAGGGAGGAQRMLERQIAVSDPEHAFVTQMPFVSQDAVRSVLAGSDIFVFASSCEAFGISLLEAMAVGLPVASSRRSSIPETLGDGGVYFDPEDVSSIADAIEGLIRDPELRRRVAQRAKALAGQYSWSRCADQTWSFIARTCRSARSQNRT